MRSYRPNRHPALPGVLLLAALFALLFVALAGKANASGEIPTVNMCTNPSASGCAPGSTFSLPNLPGDEIEISFDADWVSAGGDFERLVVNVNLDEAYWELPIGLLQTQLGIYIDPPFSPNGDAFAGSSTCLARGTGGSVYVNVGRESDYLIICTFVSSTTPGGALTVFDDEELTWALTLKQTAPPGSTVIAFSGWNVTHAPSDIHIFGVSGPSAIQNIIVDVQPLCALDSDGDFVCDDEDNCRYIQNGGQRDDDEDGYGNLCDPDVTQDCVTGGPDLALAFDHSFAASDGEGLWDPIAVGAYDVDESGVVGSPDLNVIYGWSFLPPGPSGRTCAVCTATPPTVAGTGVCPAL